MPIGQNRNPEQSQAISVMLFVSPKANSSFSCLCMGNEPKGIDVFVLVTSQDSHPGIVLVSGVLFLTCMYVRMYMSVCLPSATWLEGDVGSTSSCQDMSPC